MKKKNLIEKAVESPAIVLEKTINESRKLEKKFGNNKTVKKARKYWEILGPGLTTGAADDDPAGITIYSQAGARYGFQFLWLSLFSFPLMSVVQEMCARIGLATGRGLAGNIQKNYPKIILFTCALLLFFANTLNLGANLGAMAKATELIFPKLDFAFLVVAFTVVSLLLQIFMPYARYARYLKWLALVLLSYVFSALSIEMDWSLVLKNTFIPSMDIFDKEQILLVCGILGTTISPYLFFWQTSQEVEEEILEGKNTLKLRQGADPEHISDMRIDVWSGMFLSNLVMFFIIAANAAALHASGITDISSAEQAATALRPVAGESAYMLFALGIIGTGMLSVPVLAGAASYAISESFKWKFGLYRKLKEAHAFYGVIIISMLAGLGINFIGLNPIKVLLYSGVANGLIAPIILVMIVLISSNKKIMGANVNKTSTTVIGWAISILMILVGMATIFTMLS